MTEEPTNRPVTQADLSVLSYQVRTELRAEIRDLRDDLKQDVARLMAVVVDSAEKGKLYFEKALAHGAMLQDHEARIRAIETKA